MKEDIAEKIIRILKKKQTSKLSKIELRRILKLNSSSNNKFSLTLKKLLEKKRIAKHKGVYFLSKQDFKRGVISIRNAGVGFIKLKTDKTILIPPRFVNNAINGDEVQVKILHDNDSRGPVGKVVKVIGTSYDKLTGQISRKNNQFIIIPLQGEIPDVKITAPLKLKGIKDGDWVEVKINKRRVGKVLEGTVLSKIKSKNKLETELEATIREFDLQGPYTNEMEDYAASISPRKIFRKNLCDILTLTIDPFNAKDFDDALSLHTSKDKNIAIVGVHIADVAAYITPNKKLYKDIKSRSFTAYLPNKTIPMLPQVLVKDRCSLIEGEKKLAHTLLLHIDKRNGKVIDSDRCHSIINVDKRLNYEEVQKFFDEDYQHLEWSKEIMSTLKELLYVSNQMQKLRFKEEKFLNFMSSSFQFICNFENSKVEDIVEKKAMPSHNLVEEFMLAANVEVAKEVNRKKIPSIFRVHADPHPESLKELSVKLFNEFEIRCGDLLNRDEVNKLLNAIRSHPHKEIISFKILRTLKRANYSSEDSFHYGLGKSQYSHFTSPIRRYSDLLVHLQLWSWDLNKKLFSKKYLDDETHYINIKEEKIDLANRAISNRFKMHYFKSLIEENPSRVYEATISEIKNKGFIAYLTLYGVYSFISYSQFSQKYVCSENGDFFCNTSKDKEEKIYRCGDNLSVVISSIDFRQYKLLLNPIEAS